MATTSQAQTAPDPVAPPGAETPSDEAPEPPPPEPPPPEPPAPPPTISDAIGAGKLIFESRLRFESVDQVGLANTGQALTLRTRLGWETGAWHDVKGLVEFEDVRQLGAEDYNIQVPGVAPSLNGKTLYPIINDPEVTELNRAQLTWSPSSELSITAGRQRILIDDQRFVGNVGWRQDEQTFDALRVDAARGRLKATYVYVGHVNRILGEMRDWDSDSQLLNVTWALAEPLKLQGFVYALDFENSPANSSITRGAKASGKLWLGLVQLAYNATYARQSDYRGATAPFDLDYQGGDVAGTFDIYTVRLSYESLEGNGVRGFTTPLATTHAFQGWADAWVSPAGNKSFRDGLEDLNLTLVVKPRFKFTYLFNSEFTVRYHDFDDQRTGADLGGEWDLQASAALTPKLTLLVKYADFEREKTVPLGTAAPPASRTKTWISLEYRF
ncbi:alginate export family protein [Caulobacter ginsengisoli]|nr:alginate export family protein [Caulobacter ginsengisoli]